EIQRTSAVVETSIASFQGWFWLAYTTVIVAITTSVPYTVLEIPVPEPKIRCAAARPRPSSGAPSPLTRAPILDRHAVRTPDCSSRWPRGMQECGRTRRRPANGRDDHVVGGTDEGAGHDVRRTRRRRRRIQALVDLSPDRHRVARIRLAPVPVGLHHGLCRLDSVR